MRMFRRVFSICTKVDIVVTIRFRKRHSDQATQNSTADYIARIVRT